VPGTGAFAKDLKKRKMDASRKTPVKRVKVPEKKGGNPQGLLRLGEKVA
jgi:hypothetical protein